MHSVVIIIPARPFARPSVDPTAGIFIVMVTGLFLMSAPFEAQDPTTSPWRHFAAYAISCAAAVVAVWNFRQPFTWPVGLTQIAGAMLFFTAINRCDDPTPRCHDGATSRHVLAAVFAATMVTGSRHLVKAVRQGRPPRSPREERRRQQELAEMTAYGLAHMRA